MKLLQSKKIPYSLIFLFVMLIMIERSPLVIYSLSDDTGVFMYSAWRIINGEILYKQIWDHKPPLIHFINTLALLLNQNSLWGLWVIQLFYLLSTALISLEVLTLCFGLLPAALTTILWILSPAILLGDGNYTQDYVLFYQFALLYVFIKKINNPRKKILSYILGFLGGIIFFFQPNLLALYIAILVYEFIRILIHKNTVFHVIMNVLGFLSVTFILLAYFYFNHSLYELYDAVIIYNKYYSQTSIINILESIYTGLLVNTLNGFTLFSLLGLLLTILFIFLKVKKRISSILYIAFMALPLELYLSSISGRYVLHYYISWIPILAVFSAFSINSIINKFHISKNKIIVLLFLIFIVSTSLYAFKDFIIKQLEKDRIYYKRQQQIIKFVTNNTSYKDTLMVWGIEARINLITKRKSPTRFVYQYPLITKNYVNKQLVDEFISGLKLNKPKYIIDAPTESEFMPPLNKKLRTLWKSPLPVYIQIPEMSTIYNYIENNYILVKQFDSWSIYKIKKH